MKVQRVPCARRQAWSTFHLYEAFNALSFRGHYVKERVWFATRVTRCRVGVFNVCRVLEYKTTSVMHLRGTVYPPALPT